MKILVFIVGLPGSGKTTWAKNQNDGFVVDDPKFIEEIKIAIDQNNKVYVVDPHLVLDHFRKLAEQAELGVDEVQWIFFENNPNACWENVKNRNDGREVRGMIFCYSQLYHPPKNVIPVYKRL